ncbi:hypothetical protein NIES267_35520 [Calothrix parasitica NIES-267]|uniref:Uncharacterized protein n=1 Tax=Calothrix parasitica NIES-267 TaxID=1973488 RepID=A0A1Z4LS66_9CYAN|nr:hypothetical protein NIES267_35520 [Calothrix parasitica NIES-267]
MLLQLIEFNGLDFSPIYRTFAISSGFATPSGYERKPIKINEKKY